ncbi:hypothetical protein [Enterococcus sp. BWR-S5]|uniref:hypothetical protein n=1 Tax=Enterococcus sp. BWR-S5 TaxID=2787714 RepID=UPI0019234E4D|nr:hypothetical protein [Enterococcus sp. BWR-S5]MBL1226000.1 hypothetical protein [Enterococcus sp. BWR-S5]
MVLEKLAISQNRKDESPNVELAEQLVVNSDREGISELIRGLQLSKGIANDCIKVLYEIGECAPLLIADYVAVFLDCLMSRNNRLVWGGMTALNSIADCEAKAIYTQIDKVKTAYENGSVITVDNSISVFSKVSKANPQYEKEIFPFLMKHLETCRPKEVAQHAERIVVCVNEGNRALFIQILDKRCTELSSAQSKRVAKLIKRVNVQAAEV